jgi:hypothetical protein
MVTSTKYKGDVAEQSAILKGLKMGFNVLVPVGDRLPYDLVFEMNGMFARCQVKSAWYHRKTDRYHSDNRRHNTNQRITKVRRYLDTDFDFALVYVEDRDIWYVFPSSTFNSYSSTISLNVGSESQRKASSAAFLEAWNLITEKLSREGSPSTGSYPVAV